MYYYLRRRLASGEGIVTQLRCVCVSVIYVNGNGNGNIR